MLAANISVLPGRVPPHNLEAEQDLLGSIFFEPTAIASVSEVVSATDFYSPEHQVIYDAMLKLHAMNKKPDLTQVLDYLSFRNTLSRAGGREHLEAIAESVGYAADVVELAKMIQEKSKRRMLLKLSSEMSNSATKADDDVNQIIDEYQQRLSEVRRIGLEQRLKHISEISAIAFQEIESANSGDSAAEPSVMTQFQKLDEIVGGFPFGYVSSIGALGGHGKTTLAVDIAIRQATYGLPVVYFSLEMRATEVVKKSLARIANESGSILPVGNLFRKNAMRPMDWENLSTAVGVANDIPFWLNDSSYLTPSVIRACLQDLRNQKINPGLVVIDYLQLMSPDKGNRFYQKTDEVGSILRELRAISKDFGCATLAIGQIKREVADRNNKRPQRTDWGDSTNWERECAVMLGMYREEEHDPNTPDRGLVEVIPCKTRFSGGSGQPVRLLFDGEHGVFKSLGR